MGRKEVTVDGVVHEFFTKFDHYVTAPLHRDGANVLHLAALVQTKPRIMIDALLAYLRSHGFATLNYLQGEMVYGNHAPEARGAFFIGSVLDERTLLMPVKLNEDLEVRLETRRKQMGNSVTVYPLSLSMLDVLRQYHDCSE